MKIPFKMHLQLVEQALERERMQFREMWELISRQHAEQVAELRDQVKTLKALNQK